MSFSKMINCCFPKSRETILTKSEEVYDINHTSEEKKFELTNLKRNLSNDNFDQEFDLEQKFKNKQSNKAKLSRNSLKNAEASFSSFGNNVKQSASDSNLKMEESFNFLQNINAKKADSPTKESKKRSDNKVNKDSFDMSYNGSLKNLSKIEESNFDMMDYQGKISEEEIKNAGELLLEEISGEVLKNNKLKINAAGLTTGLRKAKDGVAFFGKNSEAILNDYDLNCDNSVLQAPHSFIIYYKKEIGKYFLKSYRDKQFTGQIHIKIDSNFDFVIGKKEIVLLSENYFQMSPISNGGIEIQNLGASSKEESTIKSTFYPEEYKSITIGRDKKCTLAYPGDKSFSKIQATLYYDAETKIWKLKDGTGDKASTNGCWIYAVHSFEIHDNTVFQLGNSRFRLTYSK